MCIYPQTPKPSIMSPGRRSRSTRPPSPNHHLVLHSPSPAHHPLRPVLFSLSLPPSAHTHTPHPPKHRNHFHHTPVYPQNPNHPTITKKPSPYHHHHHHLYLAFILTLMFLKSPHLKVKPTRRIIPRVYVRSKHPDRPSTALRRQYDRRQTEKLTCS